MSRVVTKSVSIGVLTVAMTFAIAGCNRTTTRTDAQVASEVQSKLSGDATISSGSDITVQAEQGMVTLNGKVASDAERNTAARDAARVEGVRTVVNNLVVQEEAPLAAAAPEAVPTSEPKKQAARKPAPVTKAKTQLAQPVAAAPLANPTPAPVAEAQPPAAPAPAPPPPPKKVTIPAGTQLTVRLNEGLDTERNQTGDTFHGTLGAPVVMDDETVIPLGADVTGRIVDLKSAGRFAGNSALTLELNSLSVNGKTYNIQTSQWSRQGKGEGKNTAVKAGGGAAVGAIIGGIAGGGKGAAIGSVAGAGAGTGVAATKKGEQIKLAPEATLSFLLINTLTVTQQSMNNRNAGRAPLP